MATVYINSKQSFSFACDSNLRSFSATVKEIKKQAEKTPEIWKEIQIKHAINLDMFNMDFIRENLPNRFDNSGKLCTLKKIAKGEKTNWDGFEVREYDEFDIVMIPKFKFTTNEVITLVENCQKAIKKAKNEAAKVEKAKASEAKKIDKIAKLQEELKKLQSAK